MRSLAQDKSHWGDLATTCTSGISSMKGPFFYNEYSISDSFFSTFNESKPPWDTSSVTNMSYMFSFAIAFNQPLNAWDTSSVTDMSRMFNGFLFFSCANVAFNSIG